MGTYELNIILHYNVDQKQTNCEVRIKQTSSTETDHSLVMSNINNTKKLMKHVNM